MNNIQKLILLLIDEKEKAARMIDVYRESDDEEQKSYYLGKWAAFDDIIPKLELLLKDESNHPQPPISQTQMLGEVPQVGHFNINESSPAVEGETRLVGQNEQTKELCQCIGVVYVSNVDGIWYCLSCKLPVN